MKKASEDLKNEAERKLKAKQGYLDQKVKPLPEVSHMNEAQLVSICKDLHKQIADTEEAKYDLEMKIRKQDYEVRAVLFYANEPKPNKLISFLFRLTN